MAEQASVGVKTLIMAGGKGTRIGNPLKFLLPISGRPIIDLLCHQVGSFSSGMLFCTSPSSSGPLKDKLGLISSDIIETSGNNYVLDLAMALGSIGEPPVLVIPADTVILDVHELQSFVLAHGGNGGGVVELLNQGKHTGISIYNQIPKGMEPLPYSEVGSSGEWMVNINTEADYRKSILLKEKKPS